MTPSGHFANATSSLKAIYCSYLGEAFSHWFSQRYLDVDVLAPYEFYQGTVVPTVGASHPPKAMPARFRSSRQPLKKTRPDFVGISGTSRLIIESKGRSAFSDPQSLDGKIIAARNKALQQVSRIASIDGSPPKYRVACVFAFSTNMTRGLISDPPAVENEDLRPNYLSVIRSYYSIVSDRMFQTYARAQEDGYIEVEFMPGWRFGLHKRVLSAVQTIIGSERRPDDQQIRHFFQMLREFREEFSRSDKGASGPDGYRLIGPRG